METCKTLFSKCINTLNNYTSFEDYYDYLKNQDETNTFCEYYLRDKKESYLYKEFFEKVETLAAFFQRELSEFAENSWVGIKLTNHPYYLAVCFALLKNNFNVMLLDNNGSTDYFDRETLGENLKFCICGGAHTSPEVIKLFNKAKIAFSECYGMTEAGMVSLNIGQTEESRMNGSVGNVHTASCAMKILTTDGKILNEGIGELLISGNGIYASTLKNAKEIPIETFENSHFIKTGDLVKIKNGNIYFRDRIKDVIINSSGENICPGELEKYFASLLENNLQYTILGINDFPVIVISLSEENFSEGIKELLTQKVVETNKNLPLNKKVVAIYFTTKPFPITSALKVRKFRLKQSIEEQPQNYVKVELINKTVKKFSIEEIKSDLKTFFSTYLNLNMLDLNDGSLIIEELTADSLIMAELFIYIEEKYQINIEQEFILKNSLSIADVANMIFEKA